MKKFILFIFVCAPFLNAHDIHYSITSKQATVIQVYYADGTKFNYESYEIYKPQDSKTAYMVGRTDAEGRVVFIPNEQGKWLIKVFSADGHGANISLKIYDSPGMKEKQLDFFEKYARPAFGVGFIMLVFSIIVIFLRRKK